MGHPVLAAKNVERGSTEVLYHTIDWASKVLQRSHGRACMEFQV